MKPIALLAILALCGCAQQQVDLSDCYTIVEDALVSEYNGFKTYGDYGFDCGPGNIKKVKQ